jgi:hypothetical protein
MNVKFASLFLLLGAVVGNLTGAAPALATLGMGADSIAGDRRALSAKRVVTTTRARYTVHEVTSDATVVREYLNSSGVVFAVAWNGRMHPDLSALLGSYNTEYLRGKNQAPRRHGEKFTQVQAGTVVVERWGHMRKLQGRAYLPAQVPEGVTLNEVR